MPNNYALSSLRCTDCRLCAKGCLLPSAMLASPKALMLEAQELPLDKATMCADCGYCRQVCPQGLDLGGLFSVRKTELAAKAPASVRLQQSLSFSSLFAVKTADRTDTVFMPGCALCASSPDLVQDVYLHLRGSLPNIGLITSCCAKPSLEVGEHSAFAAYFAQFSEDLESLGASTVVTACSNCYQTLKKHAPNLQVRHLLEVLDEVGIPERDHSGLPPVALHDPCPTRAVADLHRSARNLLQKMRVQYREFDQNREQTRCCGLGGMADVYHPQQACANIKARAEDTDCAWIVSYCQSCVGALSRGGKGGLHILDYAFGRGQIGPQPRKGLAGRWRNRLRLAGDVKKMDKTLQPERVHSIRPRGSGMTAEPAQAFRAPPIAEQDAAYARHQVLSSAGTGLHGGGGRS